MFAADLVVNAQINGGSPAIGPEADQLLAGFRNIKLLHDSCIHPRRHEFVLKDSEV
jgi:hypothetical protein